MRYLFIPLILLAIFILFGAHYAIYRFFISFFSIDQPAVKKILILVLFLLSISFIITSIITRYSGNIFISGFYYFIGSCYGLLVNLLMAAFFYWLTLSLFRYFNIDFSKSIVGTVFLSLAIIYFFYGLWNAQDIRLKNVDAKIKNLPTAWQGKTAVQLTDIHLGAIYGVGYLNKIIDKINIINPDIIFITGDYFDGTCPHLDGFVTPLNRLHPPLGIYFVTGNHETYEGLDKVYAALQKSPVHILKDESVDLDGIKIIGISYPERNSTKNLSETFKKMGITKNDLEPKILLYHEPSSLQAARDAGINLELSGHIHRGQIFPINFITELMFKKYYNGYYNEGDFSIYTSSGTGTWGPPMRTSGHNEITVLKMEKE
jgi:uncharacterized protein